MLGSFGFIPICANGLKPAIAPKARCPLSCVRGSLGFWPVCMVGKGCGTAGCDEDPAARGAPLTIWIVCEDWILYTESTSSS